MAQQTFGAVTRALAFPQPSAALARWAAIPIRLVLGYGFMAHGYAKLSKGPDAFAQIIGALGVPDPQLMSRMTIFFELVGGFALIVGALVVLFTIPLTVIMLVAMFTVHLPYGFTTVKLKAVTQAGAVFGPSGYEINLVYIAALAALVLCGPGPFAVDNFMRRRARS